jgi:hypothetical protein
VPSGPSTRLEAFVGLCLPPACREEVLGDLHEKYTGPWQYISLAMCVVPCVMLSRIRRTTDPLLLLTEALIIYGSFLAAAWYTDRTSLTGQWGFLHVAIPTVFNVVHLIVEHAWDHKIKWLTPAVVGINIFFFSLAGFFASAMLVFAVDILFRQGANLPRGAAGPAPWVEQKVEPEAFSNLAKRLLAAAAVITLAALALTGYAPLNAVMMLAFLGFVLVGLVRRFRKSRKE